ncbi:PstS family phosphate ABC transporter substrate-binding protein [Kordiimonas aestuarii]|uniref:PstS family phosphate ABC transporter substrate-binding protein n=1 Tax=Kordiimonas aestuarii TaxID=1005925 RepID=UPI0021D39C79|nr:PstS family phosphate ABC transporter substrate-binding protein [Kordiimonas aestuarii]
MKKIAIAAAVAGAALFASSGTLAQSRDQIRIVGSSTVFPFSTAVAEEFGRSSNFKTPIVESTGSGGGLKLFCSGIGTNHPDITNASRRIKKSEVELCAQNGVTNIVEVKIGFDGIVIASDKSAPDMSLTLRDLYLALAAKIPAPGTEGGLGNMIANPNRTWADVNPELPNRPIVVLGPPPTSGTRDAFNELAIEGGCETFSGMKALKKTDSGSYKALCRGIREDSAFVEAGENDNLIVQKLQANHEAVGIFGFSFLDQNADALKAFPVAAEGDEPQAPTFEAISDGAYPISRSLFFYVKKAHVDVVPGIREFLAEFTNDQAWGDFGYLADRGLIPLSEEERAKYRAEAKALTNLSLD